MEEVLEEENFGPQYPAELYTKRPNDTALLSPLYDSTFKGIFTQETEESNLALRSFVSAVFERNIKKVTLKPNEPHKETKKQKSMLFDISIEFDNGELADIELQSRNEDYDYGVRAEIITARLLSNSAKRKKKWDAPKVYQISVLNFHYKKDDKEEMRWYTMTDDSGVKLTERLNIIFIDLVSIRQKTRIKSVDKLTPLEKWGLFFSYVDHYDKQDFINSMIQSEHGIMAAQNIVKHMSKDDENWFSQFSSWKAEYDRNTLISNAKKRGLEEGRKKGLQEGLKEGLQQGIQQGIQQGAQQKAIEAAKNLLRMKVGTHEQIAQAQNLPLKTVQELAKEIK